MKKEAGPLGNIWRGAKGFVRGAEDMAKNHAGEHQLQKAVNTLHGAGHTPKGLPYGLSAGGSGPSFIDQMKGQWRAGMRGAKEEFSHGQNLDAMKSNMAKQQKLHEAAAVARQHGVNVPGIPERAPQMRQADPGLAQRQQHLGQQAQQQAQHYRIADPPPAATQQAVPPPTQGATKSLSQRALPYAAATAGIAGLGYGAAKGLAPAGEQSARMDDYMANARHDMNTPFPSMSVLASYDEFANEKHANNFSGATVLPNAQTAMAKAFGDQLAEKLVGNPIDALHRAFKRKLYDEPKWKSNYDRVLSEDPELQEFHGRKPKALEDTFSSLKSFGPSLAKDPIATRSFLRNSALTDGNIDYGAYQMLAMIEKLKADRDRGGSR